MAATSFYKELGNRWLTSIHNATEGSEHTLSIPHPLRGGQVTTYRLGKSVGEDEWKNPLFDLEEALVEFDGQWIPLADATRLVNCDAEMKGRGYVRGSFYRWKKAA